MIAHGTDSEVLSMSRSFKRGTVTYDDLSCGYKHALMTTFFLGLCQATVCHQIPHLVSTLPTSDVSVAKVSPYLSLYPCVDDSQKVSLTRWSDPTIIRLSYLYEPAHHSFWDYQLKTFPSYQSTNMYLLPCYGTISFMLRKYLMFVSYDH